VIRKRRLLLATGGLTLILFPLSLLAHGFAQRYDLPVPLTLYMTGAALAVAFSFVIVAVFIRGEHTVETYPRLNLLQFSAGRLLAHPVLVNALRLLSVATLVLIVVAGYIGDQNPFKNIVPTTVWVIWWVGFAYIAGLLGNLWAVINPWNAMYAAVERTMQLIKPGSRGSLAIAYSRGLADWPAVVLFLCFVWAELIWPSSDSPIGLARAALIYSTITWIGMFLFGRHVWLRHGEIFSVLFRLLARFSPMEFGVANSSECAACSNALCQSTQQCIACSECFQAAVNQDRQWNLRPWAVGLLDTRAVTTSKMVFVLLMLASVTFDGLLATPLWADIAQMMIYSEPLRPLIISLQDVAGNAYAAISTLALGAFLFIFLLIYLVFSLFIYWFTPAAQRRDITTLQVAKLFVLTLIPIALAYHLAHYLSFLLIVGQYMIPLASDPFGFGWDLFGTSLYFVNIGIVNAKFIWYTSVIAIVTGHIIAVYLAHVIAVRTFQNTRAALLSQVPMLVLMVSYTVLSLWILAQPVVEGG
jgi:hypothetical protein